MPFYTGFAQSTRGPASKRSNQGSSAEETRYLSIALCTMYYLAQAYLSDKIEEAKARAAVKAQIEADKKARAEKAAREKALREGLPIEDAGASTSAAAAPHPGASTSGVAGKDFKETRLQIRMSTGGQPYTTSLPSDSRMCIMYSISFFCSYYLLRQH